VVGAGSWEDPVRPIFGFEILGHVSAGHLRRDAARQSGVSVSCPITLVQRVEKPASAAAVRRDRPRGAAKLASYLPLLIGCVEAQRDVGMPELAARLNAEKKG